MKNYFLLFLITIFLISCSNKNPTHSSSATILIKTPTMKFYDKGFISKYDNYTQVQIYTAGKTILDLKIYETKVCRSIIECEDSKEFNKKYLNPNYKDNFLKSIFDTTKKKIIFRDKKNNILIKILKD